MEIGVVVGSGVDDGAVVGSGVDDDGAVVGSGVNDGAVEGLDDPDGTEPVDPFELMGDEVEGPGPGTLDGGAVVDGIEKLLVVVALGVAGVDAAGKDGDGIGPVLGPDGIVLFGDDGVVEGRLPGFRLGMGVIDPGDDVSAGIDGRPVGAMVELAAAATCPDGDGDGYGVIEGEVELPMAVGVVADGEVEGIGVDVAAATDDEVGAGVGEGGGMGVKLAAVDGDGVGDGGGTGVNTAAAEEDGDGDDVGDDVAVCAIV